MNIKGQKNVSGFNIIEILTSITIIAVLGVLVIPWLIGAKKKAESSECVANMRQILIAEMQYSNDNNDYLVPYQKWRGKTPAESGYFYWSKMLYPYVTGKPDTGFTTGAGEQSAWMRCPSQKKKAADGTTPIPGIGPVYSSGKDGHVMHGMPTVTNPDTFPARKRVTIVHPSRTASWMDVGGGTTSGYPAYCRGCYPRGGVANPALEITDGNNFSDRHSGGANVGFVDGHVEWVSMEEMQKVPTPIDQGIWQHYDDL